MHWLYPRSYKRPRRTYAELFRNRKRIGEGNYKLSINSIRLIEEENDWSQRQMVAVAELKLHG